MHALIKQFCSYMVPYLPRPYVYPVGLSYVRSFRQSTASPVDAVRASYVHSHRPYRIQECPHTLSVDRPPCNLLIEGHDVVLAFRITGRQCLIHYSCLKGSVKYTCLGFVSQDWVTPLRLGPLLTSLHSDSALGVTLLT